MLLLTRMQQEGITIDHPAGLIHIIVVEIRGKTVRLGITAPREVVVDRDEVAQRRKENKS
jgi:carbon storage regulator CsrA